MKSRAATIRTFIAKDTHFGELLSKGLLAFALRLTGALLAFSMQVVLARVIGVYEFGLFALALTISMLVATISRVGLDVGIVKMIAKAIALEESLLATGWLVGTVLTVLPISVVVACLVVVGAEWSSTTLFHDAALANPLKVFAFGIPVIALMMLLAEAHKGLKNMAASAFVQGIIVPGLVLVVATSELVRSANDMAFVYIIACSVSLLFGAYWWQVGHGWQHTERVPAGKVLGFGWPFFLAGLGTLILTWADTLIVGLFVDVEHVAIYYAASRLALLTSFILIAINAISAPKFTALHATGDVAGLQRLARQSTALMILLAAVPTFLLVSVPGFWLGLFGEHFDAGRHALVVLTIGQAVNVACGSVGLLLAMTGHERTMRNILLATSFMTVALGVILAREFGITGVAYSTAIGTCVWNIWMLFEVRQKLGFWTLPVLRLAHNK